MAPPLNRTGIILNLLAFLGFSVFCISTEAPLIQQDILKRCQDALLTHRISIRGLAVDGRDVILSGGPDAAITSFRARFALEGVLGVRTVRTRLLSDGQSTTGSQGAASEVVDGNPVLEPPTSGQQTAQIKIDAILQRQPISFKTDLATLTPQAEQALDEIASILSASPNLFCDIRGYDSHPREARQNWVLALQRALATEDYLQAKGIADWRLSTQALQTGESSDGRQTDRIVDLVVKAR
jgi:outer membrane protein OmpA-like peptidoglycan-associated protein